MREYDRQDALFYDYHSNGVEGDTEFYVEEAKRAGGPVLELGCGTGRILIPVAKAGAQVVALDRAPAMLKIARARVGELPQKVQRRIKLVQADMREFRFDVRFNLIYIPYRAFLHLLRPQDQNQALQNIRRHLKPDGRLILNIFDPRLDTIAAYLGPLSGVLKQDNEFIHPVTGRRIIVWDSRRYDPEQQLVDQEFIYEELDANGKSLSRTVSQYLLRYVYRYEMQYLLELNGFKVLALYGSFDKSEFHYGMEQIWVAGLA